MSHRPAPTHLYRRPGLHAGRPEPSRFARPHRSLRSLPLTSVPVPPLTMPRVARAPAIPPPPPLPALSLVLTGKVYLVSVKKGRLLTKSAIFDSSLGKNRESSDTQTSVCKHFGPVLFTALQIFYIGKRNGLYLFTKLSPDCRPSGIEGSYVDSPLSNPGTIHARGYFPGQSACGAGRDGARRPWGVVENIDYYHFFVIFVEV